MRIPTEISYFLIFLFLFHLTLPEPIQSQQRGHRIIGNQITVTSQAQWDRWTLPRHAINLIPTGGVQPKSSRSRYNLLDDLETYSRQLPELRRKKNETAILNIDSTETLDVFGNVITKKTKGVLGPVFTHISRIGVSRVGSNPRAADNILDGDPTTFWEPDPDDPIEDWWIEVDLGRGVDVDELVFNFVDEQLGDPFRQFRILTSPSQKLINQDVDEIPFRVEGGTKGSNQDQRQFSFTLEQFNADPNWVGQSVQVIRIVVTDSKFGRGRLITEDEYNSLARDDQGEIVYFIQNLQGFQEPITQTTYNELPPERQGNIEHYIRERPRLADLQIWGFGDNLSTGVVTGGGSARFEGESDSFSPGPAFDGNFGTSFAHLVWSSTIDRGIMLVDMGATFWLDSFRISSTLPSLLIDGYILRGSDGSRDSSGRVKWNRISPLVREDNLDDRFEHIIDIYQDPPRVRFLELKIVSLNQGRQGGYNTGPSISQYQFFSDGFPNEVVLVSDLIELPGARTFGAITWEGDTPPGTTLEVRTRTGDLLSKEFRFFDKSGNQIAEDAWKGLIGSFKGPADTTLVPTNGWSTWSRAYQNSGDQVTSPGLLKFMQIQAKLTTTDRNVAANIRSIGIEMTIPVAERVVAEIWPIDIPVPGIIDTFEVFIQPNFIESPTSSRSIGFDEILLSKPASNSMQLLELGLDLDPQTPQEDQTFLPSDQGLFTDANGEQIQLISPETGSDSIWVQLPNRLNILANQPKTYNKVTIEGEQVPVSGDGLLLSGPSYILLEEEEKGEILYFDTAGNTITKNAYFDLEEEDQGPIRFFRRLTGDGAQFPFNDEGDSLDVAAYNRLASNAKGNVTGSGALVRLRYSAAVFLNGTTLRMAIRNTSSAQNATWQNVVAGDATPLIQSNSLSINVPLNNSSIDKFTITPNPFTPNGDGINDDTAIAFSVFKITESRPVKVRIFTLDGHAVWESEQMLDSGNSLIRWSGEDRHGNKVTPGLYLCQLELDADNSEGEFTQTRLLSVVY